MAGTSQKPLATRRKSIFDSAAERRVFTQLETRWSGKFNLYPQIPFSKLIDVDVSQISRDETVFCLNSNVDYTFCVNADAPYLSVEFDGIGRGYSRDGRYIQVTDWVPPDRAWKLAFKVKVATECGYPFIVVSLDETKAVDAASSLTILDGVLAEFVTRDRARELMEQYAAKDVCLLSKLGSDELDDYVQDNIIIPAEVIAATETDPFEIGKARLQEDLRRRHDISVLEAESWVEDPPSGTIKSGVDPFTTPGWFDRRLAELKKVKRVGCRVTATAARGERIGKTTTFEGKPGDLTIIKVAWVRNLSTVVPVESVAKRIASYLATVEIHRAILGTPPAEDVVRP